MWGGLGSQLCAWAYAEQIKQSGFQRRTSLVFHASGITERQCELDFLKSQFKIIQVHDFRINSSNHMESNPQSFCTSARTLALKYLKLLKFILYSSQERIYPWSIMIRNHYTKIQLDYEVARSMVRSLFEHRILKNIQQFSTNKALVHFRLGDLLNIESKPPISELRMSAVIDTVLGNEPNKEIHLSSDSIELAQHRLLAVRPKLKIVPSNVTPWELIQSSLGISTFIGSNSKLSVWIVILRSVVINKNQQTNYLPDELRPFIQLLCNQNLVDGMSIRFY